MNLLNDQEIVRKLEEKDPFIRGVKTPPDWYRDGSPVESCSLDLTIGKIYLPGKQANVPEGELEDKTSHIIKPGGTAVVLTAEDFRLPGNIAGIALPKSRVAFQGILVTNPGHVDPGFRGHLRFTVINMSKVPYSLKKGEPLVKLLLFQLTELPKNDWFQRSGTIAPDPSLVDINRLTRDFLNIKERAKKAARNALGGLGLLSAFATALVVVLLAFAVNYISTQSQNKEDSRIALLEETSASVKDAPNEIEKLTKRVEQLEHQAEEDRSLINALREANNTSKKH